MSTDCPPTEGVFAVLRTGHALTLPQIRRRLGCVREVSNQQIASALAALQADGRAERIALNLGGWYFPAWRRREQNELSPTREQGKEE